MHRLSPMNPELLLRSREYREARWSGVQLRTRTTGGRGSVPRQQHPHMNAKLRAGITDLSSDQLLQMVGQGHNWRPSNASASREAAAPYPPNNERFDIRQEGWRRWQEWNEEWRQCRQGRNYDWRAGNDWNAW